MFAIMGLKKGITLLLIALFLVSRIQPALPSFNVLSQATISLVSNPVSFFAAADEHRDSTQDVGDDNNDDKDNADKDGEKELNKSFIDYHKLLLNNSMVVVYQHIPTKTSFQLYRHGKVRNHVNEVFRPPLV